MLADSQELDSSVQTSTIIRRKKRGKRFSQMETDLLLSLIMNANIIRQEANKITPKLRPIGWESITKQFNASPGVEKRTEKELRDRASNVRKDFYKLSKYQRKIKQSTANDHSQPLKIPSSSFEYSDVVKKYALSLHVKLEGILPSNIELTPENNQDSNSFDNDNSTYPIKADVEREAAKTASLNDEMASSSSSPTPSFVLPSNSPRMFASRNKRQCRCKRNSEDTTLEEQNSFLLAEENKRRNEENARREEWHIRCMEIKKEELAIKRKQSEFWSIILNKAKSSTSNYDEEAEDENGEDTQNTDTNINDNEESINLTIEEDEQQLLHNEAPDDKDKTLTDENATETSSNKSKGKDKEESTEEKKTKSDGKKTDSDKEKKSSSSSSGKEDVSKDDKGSEKQKDESAEQKSSSKSTSKDDKEKSSLGPASESSKTKATSSSSRNLWVSGLSSLTRASDLKTIFSKYGKVIGAKVVTNTRTPGTRCYGFVTMSSSSDASRCIDHLHRTELHGRIISVERTKNEIGSGSNSHAAAAANSSSKKKEEDAKKSSPTKDSKSKATDGADKKSTTTATSASAKDEKDKKATSGAKPSASDTDTKVADGDKSKTDSVRARRNTRSRDRRRIDRLPNAPRRTSIDREERDHERERQRREREKERERREREMLSYKKIREERERQRLRERERELREEERRRREIRERQREEELRLAEERRKLAAERERLEREKAELLRLERERQKLEREKIELERLELKRQQMKIMATSRIEDPPKRAVKRTADDRYTDSSERKRNTGARFEAPPPPRFDASIATSYDKKRDDYGSSSKQRDDYSSKRDDYSASKRGGGGADDYSSGIKRGAVGGDDYSGSMKRSVPDDYPSASKRAVDDYPSKRDDYIPSKRSGGDEYTSSKRVGTAADYSSSKRDEYKREVEIRHVPSSSYHSNGNSGMNSSSFFPRHGQTAGGGSSSSKRYDNTSYGSDRQTSGGSGAANWQMGHSSHGSHSGHGHTSHSGNGPSGLKSYASNGISSNGGMAGRSSIKSDDHWRPLASSGDRYDRTYNERSGPYSGSGSSRPVSDRYGGQMSSRYDSKY